MSAAPGRRLDLGIPVETVTVPTSDGLDLVGSVCPGTQRRCSCRVSRLFGHRRGPDDRKSRVAPSSSTRAGRAENEGDLVRWAGDRDLIAGAEYLQDRTRRRPDRVGGFGSSVGGEILLVAAAKSKAFRAVISEGAGFPLGDAELPGLEGALYAPANLMMRAAATVFSNHAPPPRIVDRIDEIAPRLVSLIYTLTGMGGEDDAGSRSTSPQRVSRRGSGRCRARSTPVASKLARPSTRNE